MLKIEDVKIGDKVISKKNNTIYEVTFIFDYEKRIEVYKIDKNNNRLKFWHIDPVSEFEKLQ